MEIYAMLHTIDTSRLINALWPCETHLETLRCQVVKAERMDSGQQRTLDRMIELDVDRSPYQERTGMGDHWQSRDQ